MTRADKSTSCPAEQLLLYHYGELVNSEASLVEQHLRGCEACRTELSELQTFLTKIPASAACPELSPGELSSFSAKVMDRLPRRRRFSRPALGWALAGAVVVMLTLNLQPQVENPSFGPDTVPLQMTAEQDVLHHLELLQNLELLENFALIEQLDSLG